MPPEGFETATPASARPQTHALDRAAFGIGEIRHIYIKSILRCVTGKKLDGSSELLVVVAQEDPNVRPGNYTPFISMSLSFSV
jgi:hypothetical protein